MADRCFPNVMPDFVPESPKITDEEAKEKHEGDEILPQGTQDSLLKLLSLPHSALSQKLQRAALDLKETIVVETWGATGLRVEDFTLYTGTLGTAFLLFKSFQVAGNKNDLSLCLEIVKACDSSSAASRDVTFICGRAGVCALGAVVAKYIGDDNLLQHYLAQFKEGAIVREVITNGRKLGEAGGSSLMFEWYGERYWGAAHGLAGISHVLMEFELTSDEREDVKGTLRYMMRNRFPSGNYPASEEDKKRDVLVQWCHGAPGIALTLIKAAEVFGDKEFLEAAMDAAEVVWNRGLLKRVGICHGISGNAYVFLSLYRLTGIVEYLYRAKAFACFLLDRAHMLMSTGDLHGGDNPLPCLKEGLGMAHLFLDMVQPKNARFPAYEL
ncbi:UNVERIFIED_CONTAM: LanC-like protein GCL2 [Sesamum radiatum]|uniref:LanC-like protein GCL2 n=1 Tax=Sesamum radiatum TaxID=300843 RepID=A0AAW2K456_SESRA